MSTIHLSGNDHTAVSGTQTAPKSKTRHLVVCGVVAGPLYLLVALAQALSRPGFDVIHDDVSLLSNGALGWIQIANFILTGILVIAFAVGLREALAGGRGRTWAPILMIVYGVGLIGAGVFVADPMNGFPVGASQPTHITMRGLMHAVSGGMGFIGLMSACIVVARRFRSVGREGLSYFSAVTGIVFFLAFAGIASGSSSATVVLAFWCAVILSWAWTASLAITALHRPETFQAR